MSTQLKPSQQARLAQLPSRPVQIPASPAGLEQLGVTVPASPVQKHEACSNVMQVYAAQYGVSGVRLTSMPSTSAGMHTYPSS